jgi:hypothetical protein
MEWFEEPILARTFYEIIQVEQDLELAKQSLSLKSDFNISDCFGIFDLSMVGSVTKF